MFEFRTPALTANAFVVSFVTLRIIIFFSIMFKVEPFLHLFLHHPFLEHITLQKLRISVSVEDL